MITDDYRASMEATNYLISVGHRRIVGVFKSDDMQGERRYLGYVRALIDNGICIQDEYIFWYNTITQKYVFDGVNAELILDSIKKSTAVVSYNDEVAVRLYNLLQTHNLSIPQDVSMISFDNSINNELNKVKITSINHPKEKLGRLVAKQIIDMIEDIPCESYKLSMEIVEKKSVSNI